MPESLPQKPPKSLFLLGELVEHAPTAQLFKNPTDPRTADYLTGRFG